MRAHAVTVAELPEQIRRRVVVDDGGCWRFGGSKGRGGYGHVWWNGRHVYAHRVSYELLVGPIPNGLELDHVRTRGCAHRDCINPAHLEPVTHHENILRGVSPTAENKRKVNCIRGHGFDERTRRGKRVCRECLRLRNQTPEAREYQRLRNRARSAKC